MVDQVGECPAVHGDVGGVKASTRVFVEGERDDPALADGQGSPVAGDGDGGRRGVDGQRLRAGRLGAVAVGVACGVGEAAVGQGDPTAAGKARFGCEQDAVGQAIARGGEVAEGATGGAQVTDVKVCRCLAQGDVDGGDIAHTQLGMPGQQCGTGPQSLDPQNHAIGVATQAGITRCISKAAGDDSDTAGFGTVIVGRERDGVAGTTALEVAERAANGLQIGQAEGGGGFAERDRQHRRFIGLEAGTAGCDAANRGGQRVHDQGHCVAGCAAAVACSIGQSTSGHTDGCCARQPSVWREGGGVAGAAAAEVAQ